MTTYPTDHAPTVFVLDGEHKEAFYLSDKEAALRASVAMPTADDWQLLSSSKEDAAAIIERANVVLSNVLARLKNREFPTLGAAGRALFPELEAIADEYPDSGLLDSEGMQTVARFFAVNFQPALYDFFRYYSPGDDPVELRGALRACPSGGGRCTCTPEEACKHP